MTALSEAALDVLAERQRQIDVEDFDSSHDDKHINGDLAIAASNYALAAGRYNWVEPPKYAGIQDPAHTADGFSTWPWAQEWWKPKSPREDLVRAGALILAEIDRLDRANPPLWCCHVKGPDDIVAAPNRETARKMAEIFNASLPPLTDENDPIIHAEAAIWPHDRSSHAADLAKPSEEYPRLPASAIEALGSRGMDVDPAALDRARATALRHGDVAFDRCDAIIRAYLGIGQ